MNWRSSFIVKQIQRYWQHCNAKWLRYIHGRRARAPTNDWMKSRQIRDWTNVVKSQLPKTLDLVQRRAMLTHNCFLHIRSEMRLIYAHWNAVYQIHGCARTIFTWGWNNRVRNFQNVSPSRMSMVSLDAWRNTWTASQCRGFLCRQLPYFLGSSVSYPYLCTGLPSQCRPYFCSSHSDDEQVLNLSLFRMKWAHWFMTLLCVEWKLISVIILRLTCMNAYVCHIGRAAAVYKHNRSFAFSWLKR